MTQTALGLPYLGTEVDTGRQAVAAGAFVPASLSPAALVEQLRALGVRLEPDGDRLWARGAYEALTPAHRGAIAAAKPALLALLVPAPTHPCAHCGRFAFARPGVTCYWCRAAPDGAPACARS